MKRWIVGVAIVLLVAPACGRAFTAYRGAASPARHSPVPTPSGMPTPTPDVVPSDTPPPTPPPADPNSSCTAVSLDVAPASPQIIGTRITLSARAAGCGSPEFRFWITYPNPPVGLVVQAWSAQDTYTWNTSNLGPGTHGLRVDARHPGASDAGDATTSENFVLNPATAGPTCTSVTITASQPESQPAGSSFTFMAAADGCPNPEFQWELIDPNGVGGIDDWSGTSTHTVVSYPTSPAGDWKIVANARQSGDSPVEATATLAFTMTAPRPSPTPTPSPSPPPAPPCTGVSLTPSPTSPQPASTSVTYTAQATGCSAPLYEFWVTDPRGVGVVQQFYSASNTFVLSSVPSAGTWIVTAYAENTGSNPPCSPVCADTSARIVYVYQ